METTQSIDFTAKVIEEVDRGKGAWNGLKVGIFLNGILFGTPYERNYHNFYQTFYHFEKNDRHFALYSPDYTATRIMELYPQENRWQDIGGEDRNQMGFCPVAYCVPFITRDQFQKYFFGANVPDVCAISLEDNFDFETGNLIKSAYRLDFGFVAGCVWGDDASWKVQYLDLSGIETGKLLRDSRLGYLELPDDIDYESGLDQLIDVDYDARSTPPELVIRIAGEKFLFKDLEPMPIPSSKV